MDKKENFKFCKKELELEQKNGYDDYDDDMEGESTDSQKEEQPEVIKFFGFNWNYGHCMKDVMNTIDFVENDAKVGLISKRCQ